MKKIFLDTEFTGLHQKTTLISIGLISDCGKTFYAEFSDYDHSQVDDWIQKNVIENLIFKMPKTLEDIEKNPWRVNKYVTPSNENNNSLSYSIELHSDTKVIREELEKWFAQFDKVEMWSDCYAYDWVLFCNIFGNAFNLPKNIYYIPMDLSTAFRMTGIDPDISREDFAKIDTKDKKHNALWDAKVIKSCFENLHFS